MWDASVRESRGSGGWRFRFRSPRWESLGRKGGEKTGTAPSYGAALMAAPPPPLAQGGERTCAIPPFRPPCAQDSPNRSDSHLPPPLPRPAATTQLRKLYGQKKTQSMQNINIMLRVLIFSFCFPTALQPPLQSPRSYSLNLHLLKIPFFFGFSPSGEDTPVMASSNLRRASFWAWFMRSGTCTTRVT